MRELAVDVVTDLEVLGQIAREVLAGGEPVRLPGVDDADAQAAGMNLVAHYEAASLLSSSVCVSGVSSGAGSGSGSESGSGSAAASACVSASAAPDSVSPLCAGSSRRLA